MGERSSIEWTDHTFNPWIGCAKVSAGCKHCYAETLMDTRYGRVEWGVHGTRVRTSEANWKKPLRWDREAEASGTRARVFCASLADVFEDRPDLVEWRAELFALIEATPHLDWQLLTKRPELVLDMVPEEWRDGLPSWVWIGTSVEDQECAEVRIPALLRIPAAVRFLSCEPLLGQLDLRRFRTEAFDWIEPLSGRAHDHPAVFRYERLHWVIIGGESGPGARPCNVAWIQDLVDQCRAAAVPAFVKQLGSNPQRRVERALRDGYGGDVAPGFTSEPEPIVLRDRKGGDIDEFPEELRVREFPRPTTTPNAGARP